MGNTGAMIALVPDGDTRQRLADVRDSLDVVPLPDERGVIEDDDLHSTMVFLGPDATVFSRKDRASILERAAIHSNRSVVQAAFNAYAVLNPDSEERATTFVTLYSTTSTIEDAFQRPFNQWRKGVTHFYPFLAHTSLAWTKNEQFADIAAIPTKDVTTALMGRPAVFDRLRVSFGDEVVDFRLGDI